MISRSSKPDRRTLALRWLPPDRGRGASGAAHSWQRIDDNSVRCCPRDRLGDAKVLQSVGDAHERHRVTPDHRAEVRKLRCERIGALELQHACLERLPPRTVLRAGVAFQTQGGNGERAIVPAISSNPRRGRSRRLVFSPEVCSQLRADAAVSDSMNVPSAPLPKRRLIATVSSTAKPADSVRRQRLHRDDLAAQRAQVADLVDQLIRIGPPPGRERQGASSK